MSTLSPNQQIDNIMKASSTSSSTSTTKAIKTKTVAMAVSQPTKPKAAKAATKINADGTPNSKQKSQMHRRSRTGCYTCRLRRKKCDEGSPMCTACKHLGLKCEYKRPLWWSNNEARRNQKDDIKVIIKRKKLNEKSAAPQTTIQTAVIGSPPGLSHSQPTSATFSDPLDRTRSASIDSQYSFNFNSPPQTSSEYGLSGGSAFSTPQLQPDFMFSSTGYPFDVDIKTERQLFVNDQPTLHESSVSTFSTFQSPPPAGGAVLPAYPWGVVPMDPAIVDGMGGLMTPGLIAGPAMTEAGQWMEHVYSERRESLTEESINPGVFGGFAHGGPSPVDGVRQVAIELDAGDQRLLDHFVQFVLPTIFPVLEANHGPSVSSDLILPALSTNKCYLHCCLSIAAQHFKAMLGEDPAIDLNPDIMRHRYSTISTMCDQLARDDNHQQILEAALGLIFFQSCVGRFDDVLPDIPWHQHFQAVASLVQKLDLPRLVTELPSAQVTPVVDAASPEAAEAQAAAAAAAAIAAPQTPFNMTLASWIDILGATMHGCAPTFAHTYREKHLSPPQASSLGLRELMGCDDRVMYLISEIACLEALKANGMDEVVLCGHVKVLGDQISIMEQGEDQLPKPPFNADGSLNPAQLSKNMTDAFRTAARIYLCSLVPGFQPMQNSCIRLVEQLTATLETIPCGPAGFDRTVVWVYLMGGAMSMPGSSFRAFFADRIEQMGDLGKVGSFGRVTMLLSEVWAQQDVMMQQQQSSAASSPMAQPTGSPGSPLADFSQKQYVHWRDVMQMKGWDYLLI